MKQVKTKFSDFNFRLYKSQIFDDHLLGHKY